MKSSRKKTLWIIIALLGALAMLAALGLFFYQYYTPAEIAIANGVRVEINLKTGEIKKAEPPLPEKAPGEHAAEPAETGAAPAEHKEDAKEVHAEQEKTEAAHPAEQKEKASTEAAAPATAAESGTPKGPRVAVVMVGLGLSRTSTESAMELPAVVSLSFSPYAFDISEWMKKAIEARHETYLDLPMEPVDYPYSDPGPYALLTGLDDAKNLERLNLLLARGGGYRGIISGPDEHYTENAGSFDGFLKALKSKQLFYAYVSRPANHRLTQEAQKQQVPIMGLDRVLDEKLSSEAIDTSLGELEALAKQSGYAVALARPYPVTIKRLQEWLKTLPAKGIEVVPLSAVKGNAP